MKKTKKHQTGREGNPVMGKEEGSFADETKRRWKRPAILEDDITGTKDDPPAPVLPGAPDQAS